MELISPTFGGLVPFPPAVSLSFITPMSKFFLYMTKDKFSFACLAICLAKQRVDFLSPCFSPWFHSIRHYQWSYPFSKLGSFFVSLTIYSVELTLLCRYFTAVLSSTTLAYRISCYSLLCHLTFWTSAYRISCYSLFMPLTFELIYRFTPAIFKFHCLSITFLPNLLSPFTPYILFLLGV